MVYSKANFNFQAPQAPTRLLQHLAATWFPFLSHKAFFPLLPLFPLLLRGRALALGSLLSPLSAQRGSPGCFGHPWKTLAMLSLSPIIKVFFSCLDQSGWWPPCALAYTTQEGRYVTGQAVLSLMETYLILAPQGWH